MKYSAFEKKKMYKSLCFSVVLGSIILHAAEWKNIPYYEKNFPIQGNKAALQERCKLDIKTPNRKGFPTLIWFHGGGLSRGGKFYPEHLDTTKIGVVAVNYRLSGKNVRHPDYIYDAAAAVSWVLNNIEKYGGDAKKIFVSGHSAGGYLTAMVALDKKYLKTFGHSPKELAGFYPVSGQMSTHFQILAERRKSDPGTPDFSIDDYAPLRHASADAPPMIFFCGDPAVEWPARVEENQLLAARLKYVYKHQEIKFISIPLAGHGGCLPPSIAIINRLLKRK